MHSRERDRPSPIVVIGGGGMGHCVLDVVDAVNGARRGHGGFEVIGVVDDGSPDRVHLELRGTRFLGGLDAVDDLANDVGYVLGIGSPTVRRQIDLGLARTGRSSPTLVHPNAHVGFGVEIGPGGVICSHVSIENKIRLGRHVHVNQNSTVGHDATLADYCTISPLSAVSGGVRLEEAAFVGSGASIRQGVVVGVEAVIGLGAAVIGDVAARTTVTGVPARPRQQSGEDSEP